jgi:hypothetical protein
VRLRTCALLHVAAPPVAGDSAAQGSPDHG